jgi:F420-dependent oxidoreductase-like protein
MQLGLNLGFQTSPKDPTSLAQEAERLGYHSVWAAEAWGSIGSAILQIPARTPAMTAMTAATLDGLSQGRFRLGLGTSGPQVVEGWHGGPYGKPLTRTREFVEIVRTILKREAPLEHHGTHYDIPLTGGTGLGKPLKLMLRPFRADIPIYLAAIGPRNTALAAEIADGWLPVFFSPYHREAFRESLESGRSRRPASLQGRSFDMAPTVGVSMGDDLEACWNSQKPTLALYVGGMGAKGRNFYFDLACRYGYEDAAQTIQALYLNGKKQEAIAAVPNQLVDEVTLCGPRARIAERLDAWKEAGVTTLICNTTDPSTLRTVAELVL